MDPWFSASLWSWPFCLVSLIQRQARCLHMNSNCCKGIFQTLAAFQQFRSTCNNSVEIWIPMILVYDQGSGLGLLIPNSFLSFSRSPPHTQINQPTNQSINQSINQSTLFKCYWGRFSIAANWRHSFVWTDCSWLHYLAHSGPQGEVRIG